jgi:hypothetical protein
MLHLHCHRPSRCKGPCSSPTGTASSRMSRATPCRRAWTRTRCGRSRAASASPTSCCSGDWRRFERWQSMAHAGWGQLHIAPIDFQALSYYSAPKSLQDGPKSLADVDPKLLETYEKLGVPLHERARLAGVAVDAVFDSVSVGTTFREQLAAVGVIFCSFSHAVQHHPELIERYLGSVVPPGDNFYAALNSAVFSDGSFVYIPRACAARWSCRRTSASMRATRAVRAHADHRRGRQPRQLPRRLHGAAARRAPAARRGGGTDRARRRRHQVFDGAELVPRRRTGARRHLQLRHQARAVRRRSVRTSPGRRSRPARPSPGSTRAWCCAATTRAASSTRSR